MRAASVAMVSDEQYRREREEAARTIRRALEIAAKAEPIAAKVEHMGRLYRERLVGRRDKA